MIGGGGQHPREIEDRKVFTKLGLRGFITGSKRRVGIMSTELVRKTYHQLKSDGLFSVFRGGVFLFRRKAKLYKLDNRLQEAYYNAKFKKCEAARRSDRLNPLRLVNIDPNTVEEFSGRVECWDSKIKDIGKVMAGDWDIDDSIPATDPLARELYFADKFKNTVWYQSLYDHFENGVDWKQTEFIKRVNQVVSDDNPFWHGCTTEGEVEQRCRDIDSIFDRISASGYKTQRQIHPQKTLLNRYSSEVIIDISRNGKPLFVDGRHRLALAQILGLDKIPVGVIVRHKQWMEKRRRVENGENVVEGNHPDLAEHHDDLETIPP